MQKQLPFSHVPHYKLQKNNGWKHNKFGIFVNEQVFHQPKAATYPPDGSCRRQKTMAGVVGSKSYQPSTMNVWTETNWADRELKNHRVYWISKNFCNLSIVDQTMVYLRAQAPLTVGGPFHMKPFWKPTTSTIRQCLSLTWSIGRGNWMGAKLMSLLEVVFMLF